MQGDVTAMAVFTLVGAITPGPVNLLALQYGVGGGLARPLGYVTGASASYGVLVWLTGTGLSLLAGYPAVAQWMQWAGAAYLAWLAWRIATAPVSGDAHAGAPASPGAWRALVNGGLFQVANPKAWIAALAGVALFVSAGGGARAVLLTYCMVSVVGCAAGVAVWAAAGGMLKAWLAAPHRQRLCNRLLGGLLGMTVIAMLC
jgi:threonine/homoserine/homoserine lactone efflux protein